MTITRTFVLRNPDVIAAMKAFIDSNAMEMARQDKPLAVTVVEHKATRKQEQNALMWAGPLRDIAEQAWHKGRQYSAEVWHETYKRLYLPDEFDPELCREGYQKWDFDRYGVRVLIGSTTQLTVRGFAQYLEQVIADGAEMGVMFSVSPNEGRRAA